MTEAMSPLAALRAGLDTGRIDLAEAAQGWAARANGNLSANTYVGFDGAEMRSQVRDLPARFPGAKPPLYGVPISIKDCFDLAGRVTACGSRFYQQHHGVANEDSAVAARLRDLGCLIPGKTHLHPLAYGITGQNAEYGDCLQPRDAGVLTGGSSSGAAASVQEGSALAAIGTDTGGSIRVPAALCGLVGWRCSQGLTAEGGAWPDAWRGGAHLAATFDTIGLLFRDAQDTKALVGAVFGVQPEAPARVRVGVVGKAFLFDCEQPVVEAYRTWQQAWARLGAELVEFETVGWEDALTIFAGIQAHEAAALHRGHFSEFEPAIGQRLAWGESLSTAQVAGLRARMAVFRDRMAAQFGRVDLLMMPCAPVSRLFVGADQSAVRQAILRYTTPVSLCGLPAVALPGESLGCGFGTGVQLAAAPGNDARLLGYVEWIAHGLS